MAQHGYLREYDEGPDRGDDRERNWRDDDRERSWRGSSDWDRNERGGDRDYGDRNRNFMLGERDRSWERGGERSHERDRDHDRGVFSRMGDEARSWFSDDDRQYRGTHQDRWSNPDRGQGDYGRQHRQGGFQEEHRGRGNEHSAFSNRGDWERSPRNFSSHQDDHYRSWRDRQMSALDRDYQDYCREREQQFHSDFDSWRRNRQNQSSPSGQQQSQQQSQGSSSEPVMELNNPTDLSNETQGTANPTADATLGTNNSENSLTGRGRR